MNKYYKIIFLSLLLTTLSCCAVSNNLNNLLNLIDTNTFFDYGYERFVKRESRVSPLDDYQPPDGNFFERELGSFCHSDNEKDLRKLYYKNIKEGNIKRIVDLTCIMCAFFPSGNDIHFLLNNITLGTVMGQHKYNEHPSGLIENNSTNIALIYAINYYIYDGYRRIPKKDVQWALKHLLILVHKVSITDKLGFDIAAMLNECVVLCYGRLDPYNYRKDIRRDNFRRTLCRYWTNNIIRFDLGSTAIIGNIGSDLDRLMNPIYIEDQKEEHSKILFFNRSGYLKNKSNYKWPEKMVVSNYFRTLEKCFDNEIQIVLTNYDLGNFITPVIEVRRKTEAERKLGW